MTRRRGGPIALLDWDDSLHEGFTMGRWMHLLARDDRDADLARGFDAALAGYQAGSTAYDEFALRAEVLYTRLVEGRTVAEVQAAASDLVRHDRLRPGTRELVTALLAARIRPVIVSGAPIEVLRVHTAALGINPRDVTGWSLVVDGGRYVGRLGSGNTAIGGGKAAVVARYRAQGAVVILGLGDSPADRPLVASARIGAWVDPRPADESRRVTWTDAVAGTSTTGSLADLAVAVGGWT